MMKRLSFIFLLMFLACSIYEFDGSPTDTGPDVIADTEVADTPQKVVSPVFSLASGLYSVAITVEITCQTAGAVIYYTLDGTSPTTQSSRYHQPLVFKENGKDYVIKAFATKAGFESSPIRQANYILDFDSTQAPQFSPTGGTFSADLAVALETPTEGAFIYYTTDGTEPTVDSEKYEAPLEIVGDKSVTLIKAFAFKEGLAKSPPVEATYMVNYDQVSTPQLSLPPGIYTVDQILSIAADLEGASIYYTVDNSDPSPGSTLYLLPISINGNGYEVTIKAIAMKDGMQPSTTAVGSYLIAYNEVAPPEMDPPPGIFLNGSFPVNLASSTTGATIYYTTDLTTPQKSPEYEYTGPISVIVSEAAPLFTIKAIAAKDGRVDSRVVRGTYQFQKTFGKTWTKAVQNPGFSPRGLHTSLVYNGLMWVIGGYYGTKLNDVWNSADGFSWNRVTSAANFDARYGHTSLVYNGAMWIIGGCGTACPSKDVWYSYNGANWIQATSNAAFNFRYYHTSVVYNGAMWVIAGYKGGYSKDVYYSYNGGTWTQIAGSIVFCPRQGHSSFVYNGGMWVVGGYNGTYLKDAWFSANGALWTQMSANAGWAGRYFSPVFNDANSFYIFGGYNGSFFKDMWNSTSGTTWSILNPSSDMGPRARHTTLFFDNKLWVIGGCFTGGCTALSQHTAEVWWGE